MSVSNGWHRKIALYYAHPEWSYLLWLFPHSPLMDPFREICLESEHSRGIVVQGEGCRDAANGILLWGDKSSRPVLKRVHQEWTSYIKHIKLGWEIGNPGSGPNLQWHLGNRASVRFRITMSWTGKGKNQEGENWVSSQLPFQLNFYIKIFNLQKETSFLSLPSCVEEGKRTWY